MIRLRQPDPAERSVDLDGSFNARDAAGLATTDGCRFVRGRLLRSGSLGGLTDDGRARLRSLGVTTVLDLRTDAERSAAPDALVGSGATAVPVPMLAGAVASMTDVPALDDLYCRLLDDEPTAVADAVRVVAHAGTEGVLVHCSAGKDRTGVVVALLLTVLGVPTATVLDDYAATETFLPDSFGQAAQELVAQLADSGEHLDGDRVLELATRSPRAAMERALQHLQETHGGAEAYLRSAGLADADLGALRHRMLDRAACCASPRARGRASDGGPAG